MLPPPLLLLASSLALLSSPASAVSGGRAAGQAAEGARPGFLQTEELTLPSGRAHGDSESGTGMKGAYPWYHNTKELNDETRRLVSNCNGAASIKTVEKGGVALDVISVKKQDADPKSRVFILFGEHSRELISPESGLHFLKVLCGEASAGETSITGAEALKGSEFQLVLNGNPRSRLKVETGQYCVRENPDGVDLNRNWDEMWQASASSFADANPGPHPFSEPETQILKDLVTDYKPTAFLTVHSGTRGMYMPWAYDTEHLASRNQPAMMEILRRIDKKHCQCPYGAAGKEVGYACPGTCLDWVYDHLKADYSFAFEIYTSPDMDEELHSRWQEKVDSASSLLEESHLAHPHFADFFQTHSSDFVQVRQGHEHKHRRARGMTNKQCFNQFNPATKELYEATITNWSGAYLEMAKMVAEEMSQKGMNSTMVA